MNSHRITSCTGKHRFRSSVEARKVIAARQNEAKARLCTHHEAKRQRATLSCYPCRHCGGWHIGGGKA